MRRAIITLTAALLGPGALAVVPAGMQAAQGEGDPTLAVTVTEGRTGTSIPSPGTAATCPTASPAPTASSSHQVPAHHPRYRWFVGLFYLPRLFVNHAMVEDAATRERLAMMEMKLYRFMTPLGILAVGLGLWLWFGYGFAGGWLHAKTLLVVFLIAYHLYCGRLMRAFAEGRNTRSHVWYRYFNEIPVLVLFVVVFLVVLKPF